jgi:pSer/pThr/pTyr-binding forkhead associated (FHA) protein
MARLVLKFEDKELKEIPIGTWPITIGRAPDSNIQIDNLAVSDNHARIYLESARLMVEDLNSLNGTFLNNARVKREWLRSGDAIHIGKHVILVDLEHDVSPALDSGPRRAAPKVAETVIMGSPRQGELGKNAVIPAQSQPTSGRARLPSLMVLKGKTNEKDYLLSSKFIIIGKSPMATVRLRGWFAPQAAAQISQRKEGYFLASTNRVPKVNGKAISGPMLLADGDLIEVAGVSLKFMYRD